jgi:uncharacterized Zn-finger protein
MTERTKPACTERGVYPVRPQDLPLSCPTREMTLWNAHPQVYLDIEATGSARCYYCGAQFELIRD